MKKRHSQELAETLSNGGDMQRDSIAKQLFQCDFILAWLLKECVPEFKSMEIQEITDWLAKSNLRSQTQTAKQDACPHMPVIGSEDNSTKNGKVFYDFRTELLLPGAPPEAPLLIFNAEMQKKYGKRMVFHKRVIYYPCRLVCRQPGDMMGGKVNYRRLCRVISIWVVPNAPKKMANRVRRFHWTEDEMSGGTAKRIREVVPADLMESWVFFLRDGIEPEHEQNALWFLYVLLSYTMPDEKKQEILEKYFHIDTYNKEDKKMCWFTNYIRKKGEAIGEKRGEAIGEKRGEAIGEKRGEKNGRDKALLKAYINMKQANCKDNFICTMLGISASKLRQIKKMAVASLASV
ncbi:MAG: hypothetical protein IKN52_00290 [Victivallales bacterium]|nr:hypothetical protein [Victivallales bacterium]